MSTITARERDILMNTLADDLQRHPVATADDLATLRAKLVAIFEAEHAPYPQYAGFITDAWRVARIKIGTSARTFCRFAVGDYVLARCGDPLAMVPYATAISVRCGWECSIHPGDLEFIEVTT